ncbi:MAG: four helix bundle protein [Gemmatimonadaceae bacterium]
MGDFKKLIAWQKASELWRDLLRIFTVRAAREAPGLRGQILRASGSVRSTLAEGAGKRSRREMKRFAEIAYTSAKEIEDQLLQGRRRGS